MTIPTPPAPGLTTDPTETGVIHDVYYRSKGGPYYCTKRALVGIDRRRERQHRDATAPTETLVAMRPVKRTQKAGKR